MNKIINIEDKIKRVLNFFKKRIKNPYKNTHIKIGNKSKGFNKFKNDTKETKNKIAANNTKLNLLK